MTTITRQTVKAALEAWFILARSGDTLSARETATLSAADAAEASADLMHRLLVSGEATQAVPAAPAASAKADDLFA